MLTIIITPLEIPSHLPEAVTNVLHSIHTNIPPMNPNQQAIDDWDEPQRLPHLGISVARGERVPNFGCA